MAVQGALWLAKRLSLNLNFSFLNRISLLLNQIATQLSSRGWVDPVPDPILPEKFLESNPGPLGWQSDVLTTIPNRWSLIHITILYEGDHFYRVSHVEKIALVLWSILSSEHVHFTRDVFIYFWIK